MPRSTRLLTAVVAGTCLAGLVTGCAASGSSSASDEFPPSSEVRNLGLPFDVATPSLAAMYTVLDAEDWLTRTCMLAAGQDWKVIARPTAIEDLRNRRRYGIVELPIAKRFGYHVPAGLLTPSSVEQLYDERDKSLTKSQRSAVGGTDGCGARASRELSARDHVRYGQLDRLDQHSLYGALGSSSVASSLGSWRECMRNQDLPYRSPLAAMSDSRWWSAPTAGPSARERSVAVADVRCKLQSGLVRAWHAAEVGIQKRMIHQDPGYFQHLHTTLEGDVSRARAILAKSS